MGSCVLRGDRYQDGPKGPLYAHCASRRGARTPRGLATPRPSRRRQPKRNIWNSTRDCSAAWRNPQFLRSDVGVCRCCRAQVVDATTLRTGNTCCNITVRLAQSAERKALNLVVVGSSPTAGACMASLPPRLTLARPSAPTGCGPRRVDASSETAPARTCGTRLA